jgi:hypothetical protein
MTEASPRATCTCSGCLAKVKRCWPTRAARGNRCLQSSFSSRQHLTQNYLNHFRPMLASRTFQRIRPFEAIRAHNLHLPAVIALGTEDRNSPNSRPIGKHTFDDCSNFRLQTGISRVLHLHRNCHTPENITVFPATANPVSSCGDSARTATPRRSMIGAYGDTGRCHS